jgi:hypothetical protein
MFDLNYYNQIIEFGKWYDKSIENWKRMKAQNEKLRYRNNTQHTQRYNETMQELGTEIIRWKAFFGGEDYLNWYINYSNSRWLSQHMKTVKLNKVIENLTTEFPSIMTLNKQL